MLQRLVTLAALVVIPSLASCVSDYRDETDHDARWFDVRLNREFDGVDDHQGSHLEAGWRRVDGDENGLDYSIDTITLGVGLDATVADAGWFGFVGGLAWQGVELETAVEGREFDAGLGPYVALQGGWRVTPWLEPYLRGDMAFYFPDASSSIGGEVGLRFRVDESVTPYVMWRFVRFNINDLDHLWSVDQVELDASGLVVGLQFRF